MTATIGHHNNLNKVALQIAHHMTIPLGQRTNRQEALETELLLHPSKELIYGRFGFALTVLFNGLRGNWTDILPVKSHIKTLTPANVSTNANATRIQLPDTTRVR